MIEKWITLANDILFGWLLILLLLAGGLYFTIQTGFVQFRTLGQQIRAITEKPKDKNSVSSFQALMVSTASRVGTGNIIGVSTALCLGGYGSVFWMWIIALIGGATAFVESTLAQIYKKKGHEGSYGGPAYYIEAAFRSKIPAVIFSIFLVVTYGIGFNMLASYNLQSTFSAYSFYDPTISPWSIGAILAVIVSLCLFGGGKRIISATSFLVPIMGLAYILVAIIITCINLPALPGILQRIFREAFDTDAIFGGFSSSCVMYGIKRGLFSNEAGVGSAPNASASAEVSHPAKQGLVQILSVFIDTLLVCSATAFMCMASGIEPSVKLSGAAYIQASLQQTLGWFGPVFITISMVLFAFTTILGNLFYVDKGIRHVLGKVPDKITQKITHIISVGLIFLGAGLGADLLWNIADLFMGAMTLINMATIFILSKYAIRTLNDYTRQFKEDVDPVFHADNIQLPHDVDCWK